LPGGYIFVSVGLVEFCDRDINRLAGLIGHEIGHVVKNHTFERAVASKLVQMLSKGAMFGGPIKRAAMGMVANLLSKGYSEDQEFEADVFGVRLAHSAGYHASGLIRFLQAVDMAGAGIRDVAFLDSHPKPADRVSNLRDSIGRPH
jgi:predicted Zn-dependent protease